MAGKNANNYGKGPWDLKKGAINDFVAVTASNRKNAIVLGRILYIIRLNGTIYQFCGTMSVDPRFTKGWFGYPLKPWQTGFPGHQRIFMPEDMDYNDWKNNNDKIISAHIESKELYIKPSDPILTFKKYEV